MTSLVGALGAKYPDSQVLFDDTFDSGPSGWVQLMGGGFSAPYSSNSPSGAVSLVSWPSLDGRSSLEFHGEDGIDTPNSDPMVLKRLSRINPAGVVGFDVWFAWRSRYSTNNHPRAVDFGIDTADGEGARRFGKIRLYHSDGSDKWQLGSGPTAEQVFTDIPDSAGLLVGINENKAGWNHFRFFFDLTDHTYAGLVVNGHPFGTIVGGDALPTGGGVDEFIDEGTLAPFTNGMNFCVQMRQRTDTASNKVWGYLARAKGYRA